MGIAIQALSEGLREAANHSGGVALCRLRLPLPQSGNSLPRRGSITRSRPRASAVNFREPPTPEVRGTPKYSRNQTVASRTRLLHFLAPFVATWHGYRRRSGR